MVLTAIAVAFAPSAGNVGGLLAARAQQAVPPVVSPTAVPADTTFTRAELETLLKPIALFPDPLLAQISAGRGLSARHRAGVAVDGQ